MNCMQCGQWFDTTVHLCTDAGARTPLPLSAEQEVVVLRGIVRDLERRVAQLEKMMHPALPLEPVA